MEGIHGVDVSWLHHSNREHQHRLHAASSAKVAKDTPPKNQSHGNLPVQPPTASGTPDKATSSIETKDMAATSSPASSASAPIKGSSKRPGLMGRTLSDKSASTVSTTSSEGSGKSALRKGSWIKNLKDQFGGTQSQQSNSQAASLAAVAKAVTNGSQTSGAPAHANGHTAPKEGSVLKQQHALEEAETTPTPEKSPKSGSFFNAFRRLSSSSNMSAQGQLYPKGGLCPRRVMNVDPNRERCTMKELDQSKLRKVSFCVDVEIVGGPKYHDDVDPEKRAAKFKDQKLKEKGEGAALRNPSALAEEKDTSGVVQGEDVGTPAASNPEGTTADATQAQDADTAEKKTRQAEEKRERAERKRKKAEDNGSIPKEFVRDSDSSPQGSSPATPRSQDRPTTDPLRIYRRCCQLRESPILKRITEQLAQPQTCPINTPGVVTVLNLTGSRLQLADVVALSDWLAVVPVKKLLLENADLTDEGVRVILAGLLAAKPPDKQRPRNHQNASGVTRQMLDDAETHTESLGMIEKLSLKNNPRLTGEAWKYVSLFVYMCRSVKAIDISMNNFPNPTVSTPGKPDIAEIFGKALASRLAGSHLEELMMAECNLAPHSVKRIVDAVEMCGVSRLGLASNRLEGEGLDAVVHYIRSGLCEGLDIGGNNLRDHMPKLVQGFTDTTPLWAISLADCNLSTDSLKSLFPALVHLPNFRFLDLSHNHDLFGTQPDAMPVLRKYIPQLRELKRLHFIDCALEPRQVIGLAEVIPETGVLAHLNILENPALTSLASATSEADQEEACALYASLMAAARVSDSIVAIDIDVPTPESSDLVKALAKQVLAYCLRNMEKFAATDLAPDAQDAALGGGDNQRVTGADKEIDVPEVLLHLVGHVEGNPENHDQDEPAPDDDYIVGGTGVVKILNYCLGEKANETRRESLQLSGQNSGAGTPARRINAGDNESKEGKAKKLSLDMLGSARKIRMRLQPALVKEAKAGDDMAYRRLLFLDSTLQNIITRFETEYPEVRVGGPQGAIGASPATSPSSTPPNSELATSVDSSKRADHISKANDSAIAEDLTDDEDYGSSLRRSRHGSQVSLANRMMGLEEGRMHKLGQHVRRNVLHDKDTDATTTPDTASTSTTEPPDQSAVDYAVDDLYKRLESLQGAELRDRMREIGLDELLKKIGGNVEELRKLRIKAEMGGLGEEEERDWKKFREAQELAQWNAKSGAGGSNENAVSD